MNSESAERGLSQGASVVNASADEAEGAQVGAAMEGGVGLGVDLVNIARMERILARSPRFKERVYSAEERAYCDRSGRPAAHYATRFAAKEAVLKALGTGFSQGIAPSDVEVVRQGKGRPTVRLYGRARMAADAAGVRDIPLSLSFTHTDAVACAMAITDSSVRAADERRDPMQELAQQFKETRSLLDEIPANLPPQDARYPAMEQLQTAQSAVQDSNKPKE